MNDRLQVAAGERGYGVGDEETRRLMREGDEKTRRLMRVLHEEVLARIATIGEGRPPGLAE